MEDARQGPRVLVVRGGAIGDFILTLPAIKLLRDSIPGVRIEVLGYKPVIELAVAAGIADSTRSLEHATMARWFAPGVPEDDPLRGYFQGFNLIVSYLYDPDGIFRANMESAGVRTFIEVPHQVETGRGPAAVQLARPLEKLAMFLDDPAPRVAIAPAPRAAPEPLIALHPGSGSKLKNWPKENWSRLIAALAGEFPQCRVVLVTGEAEAERGVTEFFSAELARRDLRISHWDQLPLVELASRLASCAAFLGHDSGISHLAAACGVRCLLLFGPTDPATWAPPHEGVRVLREPAGDIQRLPFDAVYDAAADFVARAMAEI
jgi:ADP-heptose:LPS heptosyltransferase